MKMVILRAAMFSRSLDPPSGEHYMQECSPAVCSHLPENITCKNGAKWNPFAMCHLPPSSEHLRKYTVTALTTNVARRNARSDWIKQPPSKLAKQKKYARENVVFDGMRWNFLYGLYFFNAHRRGSTPSRYECLNIEFFEKYCHKHHPKDLKLLD